MSNATTINLRAILLKEDDWWSAQCLEHDVTAQARSLRALVLELQRVLTAHVHIGHELGRKPFENLPHAPQKYWDMFDAAKDEIPANDLLPRSPDPLGLPSVIPQMRVAAPLAA